MEISTKRTVKVIQMEIDALNNLITKRLEWLSNPLNRRRGTYNAVKLDTLQMQRNLDALKEELTEIIRTNLKYQNYDNEEMD